MSLYDTPIATLDGKPGLLAGEDGKVTLMVNVASKCGLTPQYTGLEKIQGKYADRGFDVVGFPCNQFGAQEPGNADEIANFCSLTYDVSFPMMGKIDVNGPATHPLYAWLKGEKKGILGTEGIKWNFTKFLIDREGQVAARFAPTATPQSLEGAVEALL
jgi:glutathione peroxidase